MTVTSIDTLKQELSDQRRRSQAFHRHCISEGHRNLRQAAQMSLPVHLFADFALALGFMKVMAPQLASAKALERLREMGRAELEAMGVEGTDEEPVEIEAVLESIPQPEGLKQLLAAGLRRVKKDDTGRRFAGLGRLVQVSAAVERLGGTCRVVSAPESDEAVTLHIEAPPQSGSGAEPKGEAVEEAAETEAAPPQDEQEMRRPEDGRPEGIDVGADATAPTPFPRLPPPLRPLMPPRLESPSRPHSATTTIAGVEGIGARSLWRRLDQWTQNGIDLALKNFPARHRPAEAVVHEDARLGFLGRPEAREVFSETLE